MSKNKKENTKKEVVKELHKVYQIDNIDINTSISEGFWKTGDNRYVKIQEINDPLYLQKILFTLASRELKHRQLIKQYIESIDNTACLVSHVLLQMKELKYKPEIKINFLENTVNDQTLIEQKRYIDELISKL